MLINFTFQSVTQDPPPALNCPLLTQTEFCTITYQDNLILQNRTCAQKYATLILMYKQKYITHT